MKKKINNHYILYYLIILLFFSYFFLYFKHQVGNDSTVSEWLINYEGGFLVYGAKVAVHYIHRITALILTVFFLLTLYVVFKLRKHSFLKKLMGISSIFFVLQNSKHNDSMTSSTRWKKRCTTKPWSSLFTKGSLNKT